MHLTKTRSSVAVAALAAATIFAAPALAARPPSAGPPGPAPSPLVLGATLCSLSDIGGGATACAGFYEGNLNGGSNAQNTATAEALNTLLGVNTFTATSFTVLGNLSGGNLLGSAVNFAPALYGDTVVSFHVGGANGQVGGVGYNATAFYRFNAGTTGLDTFAFTRPGLSNARLYLTQSAPLPPPIDPLGGISVPEPATWAMMILGFGAAGAMLRRRRVTLAA